jgi:hypothetical protein
LKEFDRVSAVQRLARPETESGLMYHVALKAASTEQTHCLHLARVPSGSVVLTQGTIGKFADVYWRDDWQVAHGMWKRARTIDLQPWPSVDRPRVLIEQADPDRSLELAGEIRRAGCSVGICRGPDAAANPATRCPLHRLEPCVAVEGADLVVTALNLEQADSLQVLRGLRTRYPSIPLVVQATVDQTLELGDLLTGCTVVPVDADAIQLSHAVVAALGQTTEPGH